MTKRTFHPIQKRGRKWVVLARRSGRVLGTFGTYDEALAQLRGIERSMHSRHNPPDETYNGWSNWETWNVALWIGNDEGLYRMTYDFARHWFRRHSPSEEDGLYEAFVHEHEEVLGLETPDGARWLDRWLDYGELDTMMAELVSE